VLFETLNVGRLEPQALALAGAADIDGVELAVVDVAPDLLGAHAQFLRGLFGRQEVAHSAASAIGPAIHFRAALRNAKSLAVTS
jgi:hypothetical protein